MFKIVKTTTLAALRAQAAQLDSLRQQLATARQDVEAARTDADAARIEAQRAQADLQGVVDDRLIGLAALRDAVRDPARRPSVRGLIAVSVLRDQLKDAEALAAKTGRELDPGLRFLQAVLGDENDDGTLPAVDNTGAQGQDRAESERQRS